VTAALLAFIGAISAPPDLSGRWTLTSRSSSRGAGRPTQTNCTVKQVDQNLSVRCDNGLALSGEVDGPNVRLSYSTGEQGDIVIVNYRGVLNPARTRFSGTWGWFDMREGTFDARRR
jgi:hypothetical protein